MKVRVWDETINDIGSFRRSWGFECGCEVFGTFADFSDASGIRAFRHIGIFYCKNHATLVEKLEEEFGNADLVFEDELMDFMEEAMGEKLEFE
jgi:hypothetical protein